MIRKSTPEQEVKKNAPSNHEAGTGLVGCGKTHLSQGLLLHGSTVSTNRHGSHQVLGAPAVIIEEREKNTTKFLAPLPARSGKGLDSA